jgi:hypothetical protein
MRKEKWEKGKEKLSSKENRIAFQIFINYIFEWRSYLFLILDRNNNKDDDTQIQFNRKNWIYSIAKIRF